MNVGQTFPVMDDYPIVCLYVLCVCVYALVPPSAQSQMAVVSGFKGEQGIELRCLVEGNPKPEVEWFFKGEKLTDSLHYRVAENGSLIMVVVLSQLAGDYVCLAQNLMGNNSATVHFEYAGM